MFLRLFFMGKGNFVLLVDNKTPCGLDFPVVQ